MADKREQQQQEEWKQRDMKLEEDQKDWEQRKTRERDKERHEYTEVLRREPRGRMRIGVKGDAVRGESTPS